jgi:chromosome partitioning protein
MLFKRCGHTSGVRTLATIARLGYVKQKIGKVAVIDTDPQASLAGWWNLREAERPAFVQTTLKDLPEQLKALMDTGYQVVVIDTPGADVSFTRSILKHCDLAIVTTATSQRARPSCEGRPALHPPDRRS